jgi:hypothetical protein
MFGISLPLPALLFWRSEDGRRVAIWCFFVGCVNFIAYAFRSRREPELSWNERMAAHGVLLLLAWAVNSLLWLATVGFEDLVALFLTFQILIPSFCVVPYMVLITRKPFAAVVFSLSLVGSMKLLGCIVVVLVYGWYADARGYTTMPWIHPNLLVLLFWLNTGALSLSFYILGRKRFLRDRIRAA